ncbi:Uu.00g136260.m01.CDS01 [Anthostomella pinea]|uniref:Uu.00g136260.m01.CDS01 n=1 Tax=Anthostomella pinea TaxID=933095 RepID=A0AAI8VPC2_9PEZI|nr:Uu.00g136260.m01.CDS01 [Anthostomella pinea]
MNEVPKLLWKLLKQRAAFLFVGGPAGIRLLLLLVRRGEVQLTAGAVCALGWKAKTKIAPIKFISKHELPANKTLGHPHVNHGVFTASGSRDEFHPADSIATFLYNCNPKLLKKFLDIDGPEVEIACKAPKPFQTLHIARIGDTVTASRHCGYPSEGEMVTVIDCLIERNGEWTAVSASNDGFEPARQEAKERMGADLAQSILLRRQWERDSPGFEISILINEMTCHDFGKR